MAISEEIQVAYVDFRGEDTRPADADAFIKYAAKIDSRFNAAVANANGVVKPWNVLVIDTPEGIRAHHTFYEALARSFYNLNTLLIIDAERHSEDELFNLVLPENLSGLSTRMKFILITNHAGVLWQAGGIVPTGVALWDKDPNGELSLGLICDVLRDSSVFAEIFSSIQLRSAPVWAIGTRQVWLGKLSGELTQDAFVGVGNDVVGEGRLAKVDFRPWPEPPFFVGNGEEPDVIIADKEIANLFAKVRAARVSLYAALGLSTRKNRILRVANTPQQQMKPTQELIDSCEKTIESVRDLSTSIDATNGFDRDEIAKLRERGVDLRVVPARNDLAVLENQFVEGLLHHVRSSVEDGHTIETLFYEVQESASRINPLAPEEVREKLEQLVADTETAIGDVRNASQKPPGGFRFRIGRRFARLIRRPTVRYVLLFLYIWALSAGLFEIFTDNKNHGPIPWPRYVRETLHIAALAVCIALMCLSLLAGLLILAADRRTRHWGQQHRLEHLGTCVDNLNSGLASVAANDWACYEVRKRVHEQLVALGGVLDVVSNGVKSGFIVPFRDVPIEDLSSEHPNPVVRLDLNAEIQGHAFKHMSPLKDIIQIDLASMITKSLEHIYALRAHFGRQLVPGRVSADLANSLERYVNDSKRFGLLFEHLSTSSQTTSLRRELARQIWEEPGLVDEAVRNVVLMQSPVSLITFVSAEHLKLLATDEDNSTEIRFFPSYAQSRLAAISQQVSYHPNITVTESMSAAGVIRITPFKENVVTFG